MAEHLGETETDRAGEREREEEREGESEREEDGSVEILIKKEGKKSVNKYLNIYKV